MKYVRKFLRDEKGLETVEYALLLVVLALAAIAGAGLLAIQVDKAFDDTAAKMP